MPRIKISYQNFVERCKKLHNDKYTYPIQEIKKTKQKVIIICPKHGEFQQFAYTHIAGGGCRKCGRDLVASKFKHSKELFIKRANEIHNNYYDYSLIKDYTNNKSTYEIICPKHGIFKIRGDTHLRGIKCKKCAYEENAKNSLSNIKDVIKKFKEKHGETYQYKMETFKGWNHNMVISCRIHGDFLQTPGNHINSSGCYKCSREQVGKNQSISFEEFKLKAKKVHGNNYDYSKIKWISQSEKVNIICNEHGNFFQRAREHLRGHGCPRCNLSHGEREIRLFLKERNIEFEEQKKFEGLIYKGELRCDFYLPKFNCVVEYNGLQHYKAVEFWGGEKSLLENQKRDKIKRNFCLKNDINIEIIRYGDDVKKRMIEIIKNLN